MLNTGELFLQYEYVCDQLDGLYARMICHRLYTGTVSHQCEYACVQLNFDFVRMISDRLNTGMTFVLYE